MFGLMFLAAFLASIVFLLLVCGIGYFIYDKNKNSINKIFTNIQIKYDEILYSLKEFILVEKNISDEIRNIESKIENTNNTIYDLKENMRK